MWASLASRSVGVSFSHEALAALLSHARRVFRTGSHGLVFHIATLSQIHSHTHTDEVALSHDRSTIQPPTMAPAFL
jgi:hypothetical protein